MQSLEAYHLRHVFDQPVSIVVVDVSMFVEQSSELFATTFNHPDRIGKTQFFDHVEMIEVIVDMEEQFPCDKLNQDAAKRPHITLLIPLATLQNHLGSSILPCIDDLAMTLTFVGGPSKIYQFDLLADWREKLLTISVIFI